MFVDVKRIGKSFRARGEEKEGDAENLMALNNVDLSVEKGEFISLLGASGCGKTTLLRIIAGLISPDVGEVVVAGDKVAGPRRDLCMVFQNFALLPWRNVLDNVAFPLELDGVSKKERYEIASKYISLVGLVRFARHYPHELSGGMQQRVGIARALTRSPSVLLMDEPFAALDEQTRETMQDDLLKIWAETKSTIIFVTHSIDEALTLSDRIVVFKSRPGSIRKIIASPCKDFRLTGDVRLHAQFLPTRADIRQMLMGPPSDGVKKPL
jgi:NitT/TauT family transport system ATP-binding protein